MSVHGVRGHAAARPGDSLENGAVYAASGTGFALGQARRRGRPRAIVLWRLRGDAGADQENPPAFGPGGVGVAPTRARARADLRAAEPLATLRRPWRKGRNGAIRFLKRQHRAVADLRDLLAFSAKSAPLLAMERAGFEPATSGLQS